MQILTESSSYVGAAIETDALAMAAGAWLAGKKSAVFCQNSGLGNLINPLSSLNAPFKIPCLLVIGWRAKPGHKDEPQHLLMGQTTQQILGLMDVKSFELSDDPNEAEQTVNAALSHIESTQKPAALLVGPGTFSKVEQLRIDKTNRDEDTHAHHEHRDLRTLEGKLPSRMDTLRALMSKMPQNAAVVATTGKCGRELYSIADRPQNFYMVGSMGSASAIGLGIALNRKQLVVVIDGDGAALMRLGTMATTGRARPENYVHIVLDNQSHDSTGGQSTGSEYVDFSGVAEACGYATTVNCNDIEGLTTAFQAALDATGPHFIRAKIKIGSSANLGRPAIPPHSVAQRFQAFLAK